MTGGGRDNANRFKPGAEISAPYNAPQPGRPPTMDGSPVPAAAAPDSRQP
jgi:hypothetical protein